MHLAKYLGKYTHDVDNRRQCIMAIAANRTCCFQITMVTAGQHRLVWLLWYSVIGLLTVVVFACCELGVIVSCEDDIMWCCIV